MRFRPMPTVLAVLALVLSLMCGGGPARSQDATPEALAAAQELVTVAHLADNFRKIMPALMQQLMQSLKPAIVQGRPEISSDYDAIVPVLAQSMLARTDLFIDGIARIYAKHFAADELRQLTAFYRTPAGQKYVEMLPTVSQESMQMGQAIGQEIGKQFQERMIEELRKRGHNI